MEAAQRFLACPAHWVHDLAGAWFATRRFEIANA